MVKSSFIIGLLLLLPGCLLFLEDPESFPEEPGGSACARDAELHDAWLFRYTLDSGFESDVE